ncbi:hypothetical protein B0H67DRAFT_679772 [Lasiosphaeris hirsuta]|uniref:Uncharacterized protein n=1 Tax=Lasiosphaeris hirsuta TaxID=260670 RepID=A0AA40AXZ2_9PEZI|nr:hypothetical protein B0H67DRAFT_679772 [Lasiosphaeris hirsuta]
MTPPSPSGAGLLDPNTGCLSATLDDIAGVQMTLLAIWLYWDEGQHLPPPPPKDIGTEQPNTTYVDRHAVRVVTFNAAGKVAIIYAARDNYYKPRAAGCVAMTREFRGDLWQVSFCYCADLVNDNGRPSLTEGEIGDELSHEWIDVEEAMRTMARVEPTSELGRYIKERHLYLPEVATRAS